MESTSQVKQDGFTKDEAPLFIQQNMQQRSTKRLILPPYLHYMPTLPKYTTNTSMDIQISAA